MLRRYAATLHLALASVDAISAATLFIVLTAVRYGADRWEEAWRVQGIDPMFAAFAYGASWVAVLWIRGLYRLRARLSARREFADVALAAITLAIGVFAVLYWIRLPDVSRVFLLLLFPSQILLTYALRLAIRYLFARLRERGLNVRHALIVGANAPGAWFAGLLAQHRDLGLRVVGYLALEGDDPVAAALPAPVLGGVEAIETILHGRVVDEVILCLQPSQSHLLEPLTRICQEEGKIVRIPMTDRLVVPGGLVDWLGDVPIVSLVYGPDRLVGLVIKRLLDVIGSLLGLLVLSPVLLLVAIAIRASEGAPILFTQTRIGLHGRPFSIYKFRTMAVDAEDRYLEVAPLSDSRGAAFKMTNDPRVTRIGRFLRRSSIDEFPQLLNVLRGEMSLVGPRPAPPREVEGYDVWHRRRLAMKPGITGLWQVEARRDEDFDRRARLDLAYIDRWSVWLDLKIMLRTPLAMFEGR